MSLLRDCIAFLVTLHIWGLQLLFACSFFMWIFYIFGRELTPDATDVLAQILSLAQSASLGVLGLIVNLIVIFSGLKLLDRE